MGSQRILKTPAAASEGVAFGPFYLDSEARLLLRDGQPVALTPKVFDALVLFTQSSGRVVSKEELMKALWPDSFVCDSNLTQTIFMLRKALGQKESGEQYIVTVPGRGYRFAADVASPEPSVPSLVAEPESRVEQGSRKRYVWYLVPLVVAAILVGFGVKRWSRGANPVRPGRVVIAVLPLQNFTGDPAQEYFTDGLTEEMITKLGQLNSQSMGVIGRTSVMHYKKSDKPIDQIGRELKVQYILEGSVQRDGNQLRVMAQLIQTKDQTHIWARQYDRQMGEILAVEDEIAQEVADEVASTFNPSKHPVTTTQPLSAAASESHDLYLQGRYFWNKRTHEALDQAISFFQQAIEKDPSNARAYAGLADAYALESGYGNMPAKEAMPKAREAALKALQIDDSLAEAHTSLALVAETYDWDWVTTEKEFRTAIRLNSNYATAHHWYAEFLAFQGRFDEAQAESDKARQLDPLSLIIAADDAYMYYLARQYDRSIERFRAVQQMDPNFLRGHLIVAPYIQEGRLQEALEHLRFWHQASDGPWVYAWDAYVYGRMGDRQKAERAIQVMEQKNRTEVRRSNFIFIQAALARKDNQKALDYLDRSLKERSNAPNGLKVDPLYDPLRGEPRFQAILQQLKLK